MSKKVEKTIEEEMLYLNEHSFTQQQINQILAIENKIGVKIYPSIPLNTSVDVLREARAIIEKGNFHIGNTSMLINALKTLDEETINKMDFSMNPEKIAIQIKAIKHKIDISEFMNKSLDDLNVLYDIALSGLNLDKLNEKIYETEDLRIISRIARSKYKNKYTIENLEHLLELNLNAKEIMTMFGSDFFNENKMIDELATYITPNTPIVINLLKILKDKNKLDEKNIQTILELLKKNLDSNIFTDFIAALINDVYIKDLYDKNYSHEHLQSICRIRQKGLDSTPILDENINIDKVDLVTEIILAKQDNLVDLDMILDESVPCDIARAMWKLQANGYKIIDKNMPFETKESIDDIINKYKNETKLNNNQDFINER